MGMIRARKVKRHSPTVCSYRALDHAPEGGELRVLLYLKIKQRLNKQMSSGLSLEIVRRQAEHLTLIISAVERQGPEDCLKFKARLVYKVSLRPTRDT